MQHLSNILYFDELVNHKPQPYVNYCGDNITKINPALPTLVVGWRFLKYDMFNKLKNIYFIPENTGLDILHKTIKHDMLYWEFSFDEDKSSHINGIGDFVKSTPSIYFESCYNYKVIDPLFLKIKPNNTTVLESFMSQSASCVYNYKNEMVYMLSEKNVYGIELSLYKHLGFDVDMLLSTIKQKLVNNLLLRKYFLDVDGSIFKEKQKMFPEFEQLKRYLPVILS